MYALVQQLIAACRAQGGRAGLDEDPPLVHLVIPHAPGNKDNEVFTVEVVWDDASPWDTDPFAPLAVTGSRGPTGQKGLVGPVG